MADSKVTEFTAATTVNSADILYLIQANVDKKLSIANLLANLPNTPLRTKGVVALSGVAQDLAGDGAVTVVELVTVIENTGGANTVTIPDGLYDGQIKLLLYTGSGGTSTLSSNLSVGSVVFNETGQTCLLYWYNNSWWPIGGTAVIT